MFGAYDGMNHPGQKTAMHDKLGLPLVSIVITNFNYGRFLLQAVSSVLSQTYPNVECIIVDDASTDESGLILDGLEADHKALKIIRNAENKGQTFCSYIGFEASAGEYVVFLDADDVLFPNFVATHILVHLSSRVHAGFTTCDMAQAMHDRLVTGAQSILHSNDASKSMQASGRWFHRFDHSVPNMWNFDGNVANDIDMRVSFVAPKNTKEKYFAPTSGNCFRRDVLTLFLDENSPASLRLNADVYLREGVFLLTGVLIIDVPLFAYRFHGGNGFSKYPDLYGRKCVDPVKDLKSRQIANRALVDRLIDRAECYLDNFGFSAYAQAFCSLLVDVNINCNSDLAEFSVYIKSKLEARRSMLTCLMSIADFEQIKKCKFETSTRTKPGQKIAEFFLTLGRILRSETMTNLGERLWSR